MTGEITQFKINTKGDNWDEIAKEKEKKKSELCMKFKVVKSTPDRAPDNGAQSRGR